MRILLLSYYHPPDRAVGGHRAAKVASAFRSKGHLVDVLSAGDPRCGTGDVKRVRPIPTARELYRRFRERDVVLAPWATAPEEDDGQPAPIQHVNVWKRWLFSLLCLPDDRRGFVVPAVRAALCSDRTYDVIYTTAPPFSVHLAGLLLKVLTGAAWVAEFRDPWTDNPAKPAFLRSRLSDGMDGWLEGLCVGKADLVVAVSDAVGRRLRRRSGGPPVITVRNGIDRLQPTSSAPADPSRPFTIVYAGSFYHTRDPFPFMGALADLVSHGMVDYDRLRVTLIGTSESYAGQSIPEYIERQGLAGVVLLEGWMDRERCLAEVNSADALLLLAMEQPEQVPNKVYEYLGTRRPILAIADREGETAVMLDQAGGHVVVGKNESSSIRDAVETLLANQHLSLIHI